MMVVDAHENLEPQYNELEFMIVDNSQDLSAPQ